MNSPAQNRRIVEPELLDSLPATDPDAIRSRGDLRMINALMRNHRWIIAELCKLGDLDAHRDNWELGAGDGALGALIASRLGDRPLQLTALDIAPRSPDWPRDWDWQQGDILAVANDSPPADIVIANLILHHFQDSELAQVGRWMSKAQTIIAVEPARAKLPHLLAYALRLLGINYVTREDIHTSIRAGFSGTDLPDLLGLSAAEWKVRVSNTPLGAYRMIAKRRSPGS